MFTTEQANQSNVCNQLDQASSHSSPNDTWTHEVHRGLGYLCVFVCMHLFLTFSTSLMTRSRLFPRAALTSSSVHPLLSSSATKLGTLDTSSKPSGTLKGQIYNQRVTCDVKLSGFFFIQHFQKAVLYLKQTNTIFFLSRKITRKSSSLEAKCKEKCWWGFFSSSRQFWIWHESNYPTGKVTVLWKNPEPLLISSYFPSNDSHFLAIF